MGGIMQRLKKFVFAGRRRVVVVHHIFIISFDKEPTSRRRGFFVEADETSSQTSPGST